MKRDVRLEAKPEFLLQNKETASPSWKGNDTTTALLYVASARLVEPKSSLLISGLTCGRLISTITHKQLQP